MGLVETCYRPILQQRLHRLFQRNAATVADPCDQAACHYRMDAISQGELLF